MIMKAAGRISMAVALAVSLGLLPAASLTLGAEESPEAAAACSGGTSAITGHVKLASGTAVPGVTITLVGPSSCSSTKMTNSSGAYTFSKLKTGSYTLTPTKTNCTFSPATKTINLTKPLAMLNFTASGSACK